MKAILLYLIDHFDDLMNIHLTVSIVILFVICVRQLMKGAPKIFSYALWGIVLLRLLVPVSIESPVSFVPERTEFSSMVEVNDVLPEIQFETPADRADNEWRRENTPADQPFTQVSRSLNAETYLTIVWLAGIGVMLLRSTVSYWKLRRRLKVVVPFRKGIYLADDIDSPFVMGFFHPVIYLPSSLEPWERTFIIAHERHHIRRGDHIFKALGFLALTIHWFNPLVWIAFSLAGRDMEMSCDEAVIRKLGEDVRAEYSASLLNLATGHRMFTGTPLAFGEGDPTGRVRNLAKWKKPAIWIIVVCVVVCAILAVCLLTDPEIEKPMELPTETAQTIKVVLYNDPLPEGYFEELDEDGNTIFTDGTNTVGGVLCYRIPEGIYDPEEHIETLLYRMGIPDYIDAFLYYRGGMTSGDNGWLAEFESETEEGEDPEIYRRHHFYPIGDVVYDIWFDMTLLDYETAEELRVCVNLPAEESYDLNHWGISIKPDRISRTGATALFVYDESVSVQEGAEFTYGDDLSLARLVDGGWVPCDELTGYEYFVGDSSYSVVEGYGMVHEWQDRFGELADGQYLLGKLVIMTLPDGTQKQQMVYGEFSIPEDILTGYIPLEELPEVYSAEQAMIDGCFVTEDGIARQNQEVFHAFAENSWNGIPSVIRLYNCHYGDTFQWSAMDLSFDGSVYTLTGPENTYTFQYLKHFTGEKAWVEADHDAFEYYILMNEDVASWQDIQNGKLDHMDAHWTIYAEFLYAPKQPQLPTNLSRAELVFKGETLVSTTDFDRLEKLWILFSDGEFLGYEPKTHSIGVDLDLILTTDDGQTITIELDPDNDLCRIDGEYVFYGAAEEPCYIEKLWYYLDIPAWPEEVYVLCENAWRP